LTASSFADIVVNSVTSGKGRSEATDTPMGLELEKVECIYRKEKKWAKYAGIAHRGMAYSAYRPLMGILVLLV